MADSPQLDVIFIDIDDTLFATTDFVSGARRDALQSMIDRGLDADIDDLLAELELVVAEFGSNHDHHYDCCSTSKILAFDSESSARVWCASK
jgi:hypothetical protein